MPTIQFLTLDRSWRGNSDSPGGQWFSHATKHEQQNYKFAGIINPLILPSYEILHCSFSLRYETNQPNPWVSQISWLNQGYPPWDSSQVWKNLTKNSWYLMIFVVRKLERSAKKQQLLKCTSSGSKKLAPKKTMGCLVLPDPTNDNTWRKKKTRIWWLSRLSLWHLLDCGFNAGFSAGFGAMAMQLSKRWSYGV